MELLPFEIIYMIARHNLAQLCMVSRYLRSTILIHYDDNDLDPAARKLIRLLLKTQNNKITLGYIDKWYSDDFNFNFANLTVTNAVNKIIKKFDNIHFSVFRLACNEILQIYLRRHPDFYCIVDDIKYVWRNCMSLLYECCTMSADNNAPIETYLMYIRDQDEPIADDMRNKQINSSFAIRVCKLFCAMFGYDIDIKIKSIHWEQLCNECGTKSICELNCYGYFEEYYINKIIISGVKTCKNWFYQ